MQEDTTSVSISHSGYIGHAVVPPEWQQEQGDREDPEQDGWLQDSIFTEQWTGHLTLV